MSAVRTAAGETAGNTDEAPGRREVSLPVDPEQPLLVELFTSQGCYSCPSADRVLTQLGARGLTALDEGRSREIIPLAFHVDYWNYIGWTDPYSSARWTARQRAYASKLAAGRVYTPQLVIHGRAETVGSRGARIVESIDRISPTLPRPPELRLTVDNGTGSRIQVDVAVSFSDGRPAGELEAWVALYQNRVRTQVPRGENAGQTLYNDHIALDLQRAFGMPAVGSNVALNRAAGGQVQFDLDPQISENRRDLGVVAFLQDPATLAIHGVALASL